MGDRTVILILVGVGGFVLLVAAFFLFVMRDIGAPQPGEVPSLEAVDRPYLYSQAEEPANCIIYAFHQLGGTKEDWQPFFPAFNGVGCDVVAIDFAGHGDDEENYERFTEENWLELPRDVFNTVVAGKAQFPNHKHWIVGSSIGANAAFVTAADPAVDVAGVILFSPGVDYQGIRTAPAATQYAGPLLIVTSPTDTESFEATLEILDLSPTPVETIEADRGHGFEMFEADPNLMDQVTDFISDVNAL